MKPQVLFSILFLVSCFFIAIEAHGAPQNIPSQQAVTQISDQRQFTRTDSIKILLLTDEIQGKKYQPVGKIKVASHNFVGIKRQQADIDELLQAHASKLGGNAVVDIRHTPQYVYGTVVKFIG